METRRAFNKNSETKISFEQLMELVGKTCNYKFCIVDENIDDDLMKLAAKHGVDLTGFKHVIETSGVQHAEKRHGKSSNDRQPLSIEDYLLVPYIIKSRDNLTISPQKDNSHKNTVLEYTKQIGDTYYYVEEIRKKNKSLAFKSLRKRTTKNPSI
jgi:hypothetical protein